MDEAQGVDPGLLQGLEVQVAPIAHPQGVPEEHFRPVQIIQKPPVEAGGGQGDGPQAVQHQPAAEQDGQHADGGHPSGGQGHGFHVPQADQPVDAPGQGQGEQQQEHPPGAGQVHPAQQRGHGGPVRRVPPVLQGQQDQAGQQEQRPGVGILKKAVDPAVGVVNAGGGVIEKARDGDQREHRALVGHGVEDVRPLLVGVGGGIEEEQHPHRQPEKSGEGHAGAHPKRDGEQRKPAQAVQAPGLRPHGQAQGPGPPDPVEQQKDQRGPGQKHREVIIPAEQGNHDQEQKQQGGVLPGPLLWRDAPCLFRHVSLPPPADPEPSASRQTGWNRCYCPSAPPDNAAHPSPRRCTR